MVWEAAAAVGGSLISAVASGKAARRSERAAREATQMAYRADQEALAFTKEQYQDWQNIYGELQTNLANYYTGLTGDSIAIRGVQEFNNEFQRAQQDLRRQLDQAGLGTSGILAQAEIDMASVGATERARIRADAPRQAAAEQAGFLSVGLSQNPAGQVASALERRAQTAGNIAMGASEAAGTARRAAWQSRADLVGSVGTLVEELTR